MLKLQHENRQCNICEIPKAQGQSAWKYSRLPGTGVPAEKTNVDGDN